MAGKLKRIDRAFRNIAFTDEEIEFLDAYARESKKMEWMLMFQIIREIRTLRKELENAKNGGNDSTESAKESET